MRTLPRITRGAAWLLAVLALAATSGCSDWASDQVDLAEVRPVPADPALTLLAWDTDNDGILDSGEFADGLRRADAFSRWDRDASQSIDADELAEGTFALWDRDGDGLLDADELAGSTLSEAQAPAAWDQDGDGRLTPAEFRDGLLATGLFAQWDRDADGALTEAELAQGLFVLWDANGDRTLVDAELERTWH